MRTSPIFTVLVFLLAALTVGELHGQRPSSRRRGGFETEQQARASWQPTRSRPSAKSKPTSKPEASRVQTASVPAEDVRASRIRVVDHHQQESSAEAVPAPVPETSIMRTLPEAMPLDGQIVMGPVTTGNLACDALPAACGCGDVFCTGGCEVGCDRCGGPCEGTCGGGACNTGNCATGSCGSGDCTTCGELCSDQAWRPCITLCLPQDGWVSFEYLGWWQDGLDLPPLVTSNTNQDVARAQAGVLGGSTTQVLYGGRDVLDDVFDGGRLRFGVWLDRRHTWGVGAEYFQIGRERESFGAASNGNPVLARPFFNTQTGLEDAELIAFPNVISGSVNVQVDSELAGGGFHFRYLTCCSEGCSKWLFCGCPEHYCSRTQARIGYRFLELEEGIRIHEDLTSTDPAMPGSFDITDRFRTRNQFNGIDLGWMYRQTRGFWTFDSQIRLAIGNTRQTVSIAGQTTVNDPNNVPAVQTLPGGLLTQTSNIGVYRRNEFAVVPEFNTNVGYQLTDHLKVTLGYTFIYWSNVVRPGDHLSRDLNPNLLPPPADPFTGSQRPEFAFDNTDYWAQGISFGGEYRW